MRDSDGMQLEIPVYEEPHRSKVDVWSLLTMTSTCSQSAPRLITFWPSSASLAKSADNIEGEIMVAGRSRPASLVGKGIPMVSRATAKRKTRGEHFDADAVRYSVSGLRTLTFPVSAILFHGGWRYNYGLA